MLIEGIDWKFIFAIGALLSNVAFIPYVFDMLKRRTEPHAYTWLIWVITQGTAVVGVWYGGGGLGGLGLTLGVLLVAGIFIMSFKYGTKNITRSDTVTLIAALAGVLVWWQLHQPVLAVILVSVIDALGYIPTFRKSYAEPWSETINTWALFAIGNLLSILALDSHNFLTVPYIATIMVANFLLVIFLLIRRTKVPKPLPAPVV